MIDLKNYNEKNLAGLVTISKITADTFAVATKRFNAENGVELPREVIGGNVKELTDKKVELQAQIVEIDTFLKGFNLLIPQG